MLAVDGGIGHERREGENTPLLATLIPPRESWLERRGTVGGGLCGKSADMGEMSKGLAGLPGRLEGMAVSMSGGASARSGRAAVGSGCVTGEGSIVP